MHGRHRKATCSWPAGWQPLCVFLHPKKPKQNKLLDVLLTRKCLPQSFFQIISSESLYKHSFLSSAVTHLTVRNNSRDHCLLKSVQFWAFPGCGTCQSQILFKWQQAMVYGRFWGVLGKKKDSRIPFPSISWKKCFLCWMIVGYKIRGTSNTFKKLNSEKAKRKERFSDMKK